MDPNAQNNDWGSNQNVSPFNASLPQSLNTQTDLKQDQPPIEFNDFQNQYLNEVPSNNPSVPSMPTHSDYQDYDDDNDSSEDAQALFIQVIKDIDYAVKDAYENLNKIITIDPNFAMAYVYLGWIQHRYLKDKNKAEEMFRKAISLDKTYGVTYIYLAELLVKLNKLDDAMDVLNQSSVATDMDYFSLNEIKGEINELKGNYDEAIKCYREALKSCLNNQAANQLKLSIERVMQKSSGHIFHLQSY